MIRIFDRFKHWSKNRVLNQSTRFSITYDFQMDLNVIWGALQNILGDKLYNYSWAYPEDVSYEYLSKNDINKYIEDNKLTGVSFDFENDNSSILKSIGFGKVNYQNQKNTTCGIIFKKDFISKFDNILNLIDSSHLLIASYEDTDYLSWQDYLAPSLFRYKGGLKYTKNKLGDIIVDNSEKPGRTIFNKYFRYSGSSKMWFGPKIYQFIPQEKLLSFEGAVEIKVLENNITFVNLYETVYDGDEPHNQEVQRRFREHIGIDTLKIE
jgi:hypothetical protein